jgi:hypothetical protein
MAQDLPEIRLDSDNLYREETFTDRKVGVLRRLTPVKSDGSTDAGRPTLYLGQTQLMTQMGALPISFEMQAGSMDEALALFPAAAKGAIEETMEELQQMRREAASSIIVPEGGVPGMGAPGGVPGKIQLR